MNYSWDVMVFTKLTLKIFEWFSCYCCSVAKLCPTLCKPMDCSTPGFPVPHDILEFAQVQVHWIGDTIQPSHSLLPSSPSAFNLTQHQGLFQWVCCLHQLAKVLRQDSKCPAMGHSLGFAPILCPCFIFLFCFLPFLKKKILIEV